MSLPHVRHTVAMLHLRIATPTELTDGVVKIFADDPAISGLAVLRGASLKPQGDIVLADIAREAVNEVIDELREMGVHRAGTIHIEPVASWLSQP